MTWNLYDPKSPFEYARYLLTVSELSSSNALIAPWLPQSIAMFYTAVCIAETTI